MPTKLKVVIGIYAASLCLDGYMLTLDSSATRTWIRMAVGVLVIALLLRGSEGMRSVVRGFAVIGVILGLVVVVQGAMVATPVLAVGVGTVVANAFTFWALGQQDVQVWMATRGLARIP